MTRICDITSKTAMSGNNVPKSLHKTRRRFLPNTQAMTFTSEKLGEKFSLSASRHGLRTVEHNGGLDEFLLNTSNTKLSKKLLTIKSKLLKAIKADK